MPHAHPPRRPSCCRGEMDGIARQEILSLGRAVVPVKIRRPWRAKTHTGVVGFRRRRIARRDRTGGDVADAIAATLRSSQEQKVDFRLAE